jgi:hypothetical protein
LFIGHHSLLHQPLLVRQNRGASIWRNRNVMIVQNTYSTHVVRWNRERAALLSVLQVE